MMVKILVSGLPLLLLLHSVQALMCPTLQIEEVNELTTSTAPNMGGLFLGHYVRVYRNRVVVGGYGFRSWAGGAWTFVNENGEWKEEGVLFPATKFHVKQGYFGLALDLSDKLALVGHPFATPYGKRSGMAVLFRKLASGWKRIKTFKAPKAEGMPEAYYGYDVAIHQRVIAIGARNQDDPDTGLYRAGAVYVYKWSTEAKWALVQTIRGSEADAQFGDVVHITGTTMQIGSPRAKFNGLEGGKSFIYKLYNGKWRPRGTLDPNSSQKAHATSSSNKIGAHFGEGVFVYDNSVLVGGEVASSPSGPLTGATYLYKKTSTGYRVDAEFFPTSVGKANFGQRVGIHDRVVIITAWGDSDYGKKAGAAYVYVKCRGGEWNLAEKLYHVDTKGDTVASAGEEFGKGVHIDGESIILGCPKCNSGSRPEVLQRGAAYVYKYSLGPLVEV